MNPNKHKGVYSKCTTTKWKSVQSNGTPLLIKNIQKKK